MSKPKLLYIGSAGLGENIFSEPAMRCLCKDYDVYFCFKNQFYHFLSKYDFVKNAVWYSSDEEIKQFAINSECEYIISHFERLIHSYSFLGLKPLLHKKIKHSLSFMENVLGRLGYSTENARYSSLTPYKPDGIKRILVYVGSREPTRRINETTFNLLIENLNYHFNKDYEIIGLIDKFTEFKKLEGFKYLVNQHDQKSVNDILGLFSSGVNLMVGPDSGFTHVAMGYNVPLLWIETRERFENIIPRYHANISEVYRKLNSNCDNECRARMLLKQYGSDRLEQVPHLKGCDFSNDYPKRLPCYRENPCPCLNFDTQDIESIINISKDLLSRNSAA
jgi:hypothetical protein